MPVRLRRDVWLLALWVILFAGCRASSAPTGPEISLNFGFDPPTIDPALVTDPPSIQVDNLLFLNLVNLHEEDGIAEPALAASWAVSGDGQTWEFHLRDDVYWVAYNPDTNKADKKRAVTADDVVYSVRRLFDPRTQSAYAPHFASLLRNALPFNSADPRSAPADLDKMANVLGVIAKDAHTVQFILSRPMSAFPALAATWLGRIQPQEPIVENGIDWATPGLLWSSGPYMLEGWEHNQYILLRRNPYYYDVANVQIERLRFKMIPDVSSALDFYLGGDLDTTDPYGSIEGDQLARVAEDATLSRDQRELPGLCSQYIGFNVSQPPFDNVLVRRAFAAGLDRQALVSQVFKGGQLASHFTPPGLVASPDISKTLSIEFDALQARTLLDQSGWGAAHKALPQIEFGINTNDTFHAMAVAASGNWQAALSAIVHVNIDEWGVYLDKLQKTPPNLFRMGYCAVYPDAANFAYDAFHSGAEQNWTRWSSPDYDRLVEQASRETDVVKRRDLYTAAEKILVADQAVIIPILWSTRLSITNPHIQRTYALLEGYERIEHWKVNR
ncbi:MAG: peptide ABC transporter substrate-binding protein [Anaerolineae bacterium]